jgi:predicted enzyme related to lactoylglutathione lyase
MISHFEVSGANPESLIEFYSELFGWRFEAAPEVEGYWLIQAASQEGSSDETRQVNGGLTRAETSERGILLYFSVESVDESSRKIKVLGGRILVPKQEVQDMGWFAEAEDPEGNRFAVWQDMY